MNNKSNRNKVKGQRFSRAAKTDVKKELADQAKLILTALRFKSRLTNDKKIQLLGQFFRKHPELNPTKELDTYGVEQALNLMAKDGKEATAAKRLYQSMIDNYIKRISLEEETDMLSESEIKKLVRQAIEKRLPKLDESIESELLPGDDQVADYMGKVEKFIDEFAERAEELAVEGEEMLKTDFANKAAVAERNRMFLTIIGVMRKIKFNIGAMGLDLRKALG